MDVKEAVNKAIEYVSDIFSNEKIENLGLEEVIFNEGMSEWKVTVGFSRPWDNPRQGLAYQMNRNPPKREYKLLKIDDAKEEVKSLEIRKLD